MIHVDDWTIMFANLQGALLVDPTTGAAVDTEAVPLHLRRARATRIGIEANAGICRGVLRVRYDTKGEGREEK